MLTRIFPAVLYRHLSGRFLFLCAVAAIPVMLLSNALALTQDTKPLSIEAGKVAAATALRYTASDQSHLLIEDLLPGEGTGINWYRNTSKVPNFGFGPVAMWFWLPVENPSDRDLERFIEIRNPVLDEVVLYQVRQADQLVSRQISGDRYPMHERPNNHHNLLFSIEIPAGERHDLYFRVTTDGSMQLPIYIWDPRMFYQTDQTRLLGFGILFGVLVVMALYNLFAYTMLLDRVFLYYSLFALSLALFEAAINGFGNQYLWGNSVWWREHSIVLFIPLLQGFASLYARSFLQLKMAKQWLYNLFGAMFHAGLICALLSLFVPYSIIVKVSAILVFVVGLMSVVVGLYRWRTGYVAARYFILSWALLLLSALAYVAGKFGVIPQSAYSEHAMQFGAMFGSIFSAFALTDRVNSQRLSYMEAQKKALLMQQEVKEDLEKTVAERTQKLQETLSELEGANQQLQSISMLDGLTGIKNRRFFDEKIEREWGRAIRNNKPLALLTIDIDHFKQFNDSYGHLLGDECLKHVARVIQESVARPSDAIARYGGEEFVAILPETDIDGAVHIAEEIRQAIESRSFENDGKTYHLTASIGVACARPIYGDSSQQLISESDRALYQSKKRGRNCVTAF